ncbi:MAG: GNAT family N-acetyltransferase [Bacteroidales bacterium]|nr:GNAT family N-acetyltransferase [Bacteroidales bacterium]MCM1414761.1 GNAT family N-acetyltransferase [bacterium]MCM1423233.1 GNAT family N-acetyltransferase [bacterium]
MLEKIYFGKDILYITDEKEAYAALRAQDSYVLPYLHESSESADFPGALWAVEHLEEMDKESLEPIYRRLAGIPWDICTTKRCKIRETTLADVDSFYRIYAERSVTAYMEGLSADREEETARIRDLIEKGYAFYGYGMWTVLEKKSGEVIGRAGITRREGYDLPELGFVIGVPWQGKGYAFEVCEAILGYAGEELFMERVQALVRAGNEKSLRLCEKLGFVRERTVREDGIAHILLIKEL